jgi:hypothetical protein
MGERQMLPVQTNNTVGAGILFGVDQKKFEFLNANNLLVGHILIVEREQVEELVFVELEFFRGKFRAILSELGMAFEIGTILG